MMAAPLTTSVELPPNLDALKLPDGRKVGDVRGGALPRLLAAIGVPNVSPMNGRTENLQRYAEHLAAIEAEGARNAFAAWSEKVRGLI
jgi:hypothetical protein